jgi:hypothetical protein
MSKSISDALLQAAEASAQESLAHQLRQRAGNKPRERNRPFNANADGLEVSFSKHHNPVASMMQNATSDVVKLKMSVLEDDYSVVFTLSDVEADIDIHSDNKLFFVLREALSTSKGPGYFLMVKFARRITEKPYPCLQDPATLTLYFDPLMPFRDALEAFKSTRTITLLKVPSSGEFYRKLDRKRLDRKRLDRNVKETD